VARIRLLCLAGLILAVSRAGLPPGASAQAMSPTTPPGVEASEAGRVYLSQSLAALQWARHYAGIAARTGRPETFDLERFLAELETIAHGLERYLRPEGPPPGPLTPVEITGQFLLEGLRRDAPPPAGGSRP
jgi:hypothetical protein